MTNSKLQELLRAADDPVYARSPPGVFVEYMGLRGGSQEYVLATWELFKLKRRAISPQEVAQYLADRKSDETVG